MEKYVYMFDEGNISMKDILGNKGANLSEMTNLKLNVPYGFIISSHLCKKYNSKKELTKTELNQIISSIKKIENKTNKQFGNKDNPLLLSVRSGSSVSMPGMMDTILNIGMNDDILSKMEDKRFGYDLYRRLIMMYSDVVKGYDKNKFEEIITKEKIRKNIKYDIDLDIDSLKNITFEFKKLYKMLSKSYFPQDPYEQLIESVKAVFNSWNNERAIFYRKMNNIDDSIGTAVNIQEMVYGNLNNDSLSGVIFSRNPINGSNELFGEYLINAQGEDIVSGARTPNKISLLKKKMPMIYDELYYYSKVLEKHYKDIQDIEFTVENKKLYILQTRNAKRTIDASIKVAVDLVEEKLITKKEAILRVNPNEMEHLLHNEFDKEDLKSAKVISTGLGASSGCASGRIYFDVKDAKKVSLLNEKCILVKKETTTEDIEGMKICEGLITQVGGITSHAAVVARSMGKPCVCSIENIKIDYNNKQLITGDNIKFNEGDYISIDGTNGIIYDRKIKTTNKKESEYLKKFMSYVDSSKKLKIYANSETITDTKNAIIYGCEGIGLVRTEHMFFDEKRIFNFRKMILSSNKEEINKALNDLLPYQKNDFKEIFKLMNNKSVTIRLLDPPLHEFLPKDREEITKLALSLKININKLNDRIKSLKEVNPMMGHRGIRLSISYEDIVRMQIKAILESAIELTEESFSVKPNIMLPLVSDINEFIYIKNIIKEEANLIFEKYNKKIDYKIGTMIETVRAALLSSEIAKEADFYSFGTNDLTQFTYGISRDDSEFLKDYYEKGIFNNDPFKSLDIKGVGKLIKQAVKDARKVNKNIEIGICGEQGGDFNTICFCNENDFDYVSCSPYRILGARLSAAISEIKE